MSSVSTSGSGAPKSSFSFGRIWDQYGMLVVFAVLFIACAIFVPNFATFINMKGLGLAISMSGMVACGMLFCLASGDFDLSVASVIACAGVTTAVVINLTESLWIGVAAGLLLGILCGLVNGFVIRLRFRWRFSERWHRKNLICGGGYLNFRHRGKRHEPA